VLAAKIPSATAKATHRRNPETAITVNPRSKPDRLFHHVGFLQEIRKDEERKKNRQRDNVTRIEGLSLEGNMRPFSSALDGYEMCKSGYKSLAVFFSGNISLYRQLLCSFSYVRYY
jgi:hypothetical protein